MPSTTTIQRERVRSASTIATAFARYSGVRATDTNMTYKPARATTLLRARIWWSVRS